MPALAGKIAHGDWLAGGPGALSMLPLALELHGLRERAEELRQKRADWPEIAETSISLWT